MQISKQRLLMNSFFTSEFNYSPLIWIFHSLSLNNKINHLHERCLHIDHPVVKYLVKYLSAPIVSEICEKQINNYGLGNPSKFDLLKTQSVFHGKGSISWLLLK